MNLYDKLLNGTEKMAQIGLGYVGMPLAVAFARKKINVLGFDLNEKKINAYKNGMDPTNEVGMNTIKQTTVDFTSDASRLSEARFHIVAVPTPVDELHVPDLEPIKSASIILGQNLKKGSIVVFESTVYPGATEEICVPILEKESGLKCGSDFKIGYSPERINPGDKIHRLDNITKIVSGMDEETLDIIAKVYELIVDAGVHRAESIKVAEAAKVIENSQRDINIAFVNELSMLFDKMNIDTQSVLRAAGTKWNFMNFKPGLVGGHCIGVDPYYLTYKAKIVGYDSKIISAGRYINDNMAKYIAESLVKKLIKVCIPVRNANIAIFGLTFKANCPDIRNTKVIDIYKELQEYGITPTVIDPVADADEVKRFYDITLESADSIKNVDAVIFAVAHNSFIEFSKHYIDSLFNVSNKKKILLDIKWIYDINKFASDDYLYWRL